MGLELAGAVEAPVVVEGEETGGEEDEEERRPGQRKVGMETNGTQSMEMVHE